MKTGIWYTLKYKTIYSKTMDFMKYGESVRKLEGAVKEIDPTAKELAELVIAVVDRNYLEHSMVHFYDAVIDKLSLKIAQIKLRNLNNQ